jgi:hypothetical protein
MRCNVSILHRFAEDVAGPDQLVKWGNVAARGICCQGRTRFSASARLLSRSRRCTAREATGQRGLSLFRDIIGTARCERIVYVDHVLGIGKKLFEAARQIGAGGIVSKRRGSVNRAGSGSRPNARGPAHSRLPASANLAKAGSRRSMSPRSMTVSCVPPDKSGSGVCREGALGRSRPAAHRPGPETLQPGPARLGRRDQVLWSAQGRLDSRWRDLVRHGFDRLRSGRVKEKGRRRQRGSRLALSAASTRGPAPR